MRSWLCFALAALAAPLGAAAVEVPPELRGRVSAAITSCEAIRGGGAARVVLVRVRALARGLAQPEVRCGAFAPGGAEPLGWSRVAGLDRLAAGEAREAMVMVAADAAHVECRCVVGGADEASLTCEPWESREGGQCVEPGEIARPSPAPAGGGDPVAGAIRVSRALAPLHPLLEPGRSSEGATERLCESVAAPELAALVNALVPEDGAVYVRPLWRQLDAADRAAFAVYLSECFGVSRIVDAERGVELAPAAE